MDYKSELAYLKEAFRDNGIIKFRAFCVGEENIAVQLIFCDGLVNSRIIGEHLIEPLTKLQGNAAQLLSQEASLSRVFQVGSVKKSRDRRALVEGIAGGDCIVLVAGFPDALIFDTKGYETRSITEPEGEKILSGPREGFTESILKNLSMVQRRLKTAQLKLKFYTLGKRTRTTLCVAYMEGIVKPRVLRELYQRLEAIDIDAVLDANYVNELIRDEKWSPFRTTGYTERPDIVVGKLLEGRVALFVDGSPVVLTLPYLFIENFQSNEDYYLSFYYTSFSRMLRIIGVLITVYMPAFYIAIVAYHHEMLPPSLLINVAIERSNVPLPASVEAFVMLVIFEILRETSVRMQANVGQALSILGALVIGQAAVEANLVAAPLLIVVAITGITSLLVPKMNASILWVRFFLLILAACFGFLGFIMGSVVVLAHVLDLHSFGVWQFDFLDHIETPQETKDILFRAPWQWMKDRPVGLSDHRRRQRGPAQASRRK